MKSFATRIDIRAPVAIVWQVLVDLPDWSRWNSAVQRTEGTIAHGAKVTVFVHQSPGRAFPVKVATFDPPRGMIWIGGMPLGLFTGTRSFELAASSDDTTEFGMRETYSGPLAGMIGKSIPDLQPAFDAFAQCLKVEAERRHRSDGAVGGLP